LKRAGEEAFMGCEDDEEDDGDGDDEYDEDGAEKD